MLRAVLLAAVGCVACVASCAPSAAHAEPSSVAQTAAPQTDPDTTESPATWRLRVDGSPAEWPLSESPTASPENAAQVAERVLRAFREDGFYDARLDSITIDSTSLDAASANGSETDSVSETDSDSASQAGPTRTTLFVARGPRVNLGSVEIDGDSVVSEERIRNILRLQTGKPLSKSSLEAGINDLLSEYEEEGYPLASVRIERFEIDRSAPEPVLRLALQVEEGTALWLKRVALPKGGRTSPRFVARVAGLSLGEPLRNYDPAQIRASLEQTGLFASVGMPQLRVNDDGGATLFLPVKDVPPGTFDIVLGYLPPSSGGDGQLVGNGALALRNVLGGGRRLNLKLDRRPQQVSLVDVRAVDPYVAGWPIRAEAGFTGEQRDSTFAERAYRLSVGVQPSPTWSVSGTLSREVTRPGQGGTQIVRGEQQVPRGASFFYGITARVERVDDRRNPRQGVEAEATVEQGRKRRSFRRVVDADTTFERQTLRQERIRGSVRTYLPTFARQLVAVGADADLLRSDAYDTSDLFWIGGAQSLRGYDEDRFRGRITARVLLEYRVQIDRVSYAYVFSDLGYVDTPETAALDADQQLLPGYGFGLQFGTPLGIANLSYALSPGDSPARGRIHLGVSLGL
jgi:outer membrane protein assembly factor BamA